MAVQDNIGAFLSITEIFDIENTNVSPDMQNFLVRLRRLFDDHATMINLKDTGIYDKSEFVCGQIWYPNPALTSYTAAKPIPRQVYRKVVSFGALPNAGTKNVAHGITFPATNTFTFTRIYGAATDQTAGSYLPLPFAAITDNQNIELSLDNTNVIITTGIDYSSYNAEIVLEYIKS